MQCNGMGNIWVNEDECGAANMNSDSQWKKQEAYFSCPNQAKAHSQSKLHFHY